MQYLADFVILAVIYFLFFCKKWYRASKKVYYGSIREILLNVIMMIPFGFLFPIIKKSGILKNSCHVFSF